MLTTRMDHLALGRAGYAAAGGRGAGGDLRAVGASWAASGLGADTRLPAIR